MRRGAGMKSTCVHHPKSNRYIQVYEWQVRFCRQNHCAAFLLSHFIAWHDWKLTHDEYYNKANNIAELHGDGRPNNQNAYLFFTMNDLVDGILNLYGKNTINGALELLEELKVITVHKNPNPRYHFDKTKYFVFHSEACNEWINIHMSHGLQNEFINEAGIENSLANTDGSVLNDRDTKNNLPSIETNRPSVKKGRAITNTTNNTTNIDQSITDLPFEDKREIKQIVDALVSNGFPKNRFRFSDAIASIHRLWKQGADSSVFINAYEKSLTVTGSNSFGVNYLVKVVEDLMKPLNKKENNQHKSRHFNNDIPADFDWLEEDI